MTAMTTTTKMITKKNTTVKVIMVTNLMKATRATTSIGSMVATWCQDSI